MTEPKKTDSQLAIEVYNRTRRELIAARGMGWSPSAIDRLAAVGDPESALAKLVATYDTNDAALVIVLNSAGIMPMRSVLDQLNIDTEMLE